MVEAAQAQVCELHGQINVPQPYSAIYHDWSEDPFGAGWHEWKAGVRFDTLMKKIRQPVSRENIFICGEAYSNNQGWVEGALQTSERMLEEHFGMPRPGWLDPSYDLGP
jgi:monoamine oxidase